jgi:FkbM family methyltransferase
MNLHIVKQYFEPKSILDIGGHVGGFYHQCKSLFNFDRYFLIEGNENCEPDLKSLNIPFYIGLVGKEIGETVFYKTKDDPKSTGNSIYRENTKHFNDDKVIIEKKKIVTVDSLLNESFDLIKIDTQGAELDILEGAKKTIKNTQGIILEVSLIQYNQNAPLIKEVIEYMENIGYYETEILFNHHFADGTLFQKDILFLRK